MNCQTDFVSTNEGFQDVLKTCAAKLFEQSQSGGNWTTQHSGEYAVLRGADLSWVMVRVTYTVRCRGR
jgi:translation elongation factor EF-Ts